MKEKRGVPEAGDSARKRETEGIKRKKAPVSTKRKISESEGIQTPSPLLVFFTNKPPSQRSLREGWNE